MELIQLRSLNFEFLRSSREELAALGAFAEEYAHSDPAGALVKLRTFAELMVYAIYRDLALPRLPYQADLIQLLNSDAFRDLVPRVILDKLHLLRVRGSKAAHGTAVTASSALELIRDAFDLARWFAVTFLGARLDALPAFTAIPPRNTEAAARANTAAAQEQRRSEEARVYELLQALEAAKERAIAAENRANELAATSAKGAAAAGELAFDEATTRKRLIDAELTDAGWTVGRDGSKTDEVPERLPRADLVSSIVVSAKTNFRNYSAHSNLAITSDKRPSKRSCRASVG